MKSAGIYFYDSKTKYKTREICRERLKSTPSHRQVPRDAPMKAIMSPAFLSHFTLPDPIHLCVTCHEKPCSQIVCVTLPRIDLSCDCGARF